MLSLMVRDRYEMKNFSLWIVDKSVCTVNYHNMMSSTALPLSYLSVTQTNQNRAFQVHTF